MVDPDWYNQASQVTYIASNQAAKGKLMKSQLKMFWYIHKPASTLKDKNKAKARSWPDLSTKGSMAVPPFLSSIITESPKCVINRLTKKSADSPALSHISS